ncbi:hypothetical protein THRCLA_07073 [Thraustotheca clavata]|uniref:PH domain-containing protein n=1 Tax=Thraustotheca clavata TaxID=74557 RepID=A0A1V9ZGT9_9STRA|nr:hypothetical protein THRCLA_07073 [Thraustotheca clavata]
MADNEEENAYEKLSREVHQAQTTGAIHPDWLENPCGFLLKPDFKRKMQHMGAGGKKLQTSIRGLRLHLPGSSYRSRWFVLDGMMLKYFRSKNDDQELGAIHLTSVNAVLPSSMADAPEHALDLVCADRIYTVAAATREDMVRWATVLTLVLRGEYEPKLMQRRESAVIRGSSVIPPHNGRSSVIRQASQVIPPPTTYQPSLTPFDEEPEDKEREMDAKLRALSAREKLVTVTFDTPGPLHLLLQSTMEGTIMVRGFQEPSEGGVGLAEATGVIMVGDVLTSIQDHTFTTISFSEAIQEVQQASRPLTLRFSRLEAPPIKQQVRLAQGWVLAKEPATNRIRIRLLQLQGSKLHLFKSGLHAGRQDRPVLSLSLDDVSDLRPIHDKRTTESVQGFPKTYGLTLESTQFIFSFYVLTAEEQSQWIDVLKNVTIFEKSRKTTHNVLASIPVHPVSIVNNNTKACTSPLLLESEVLKWSDLTYGFESRYLVLYSSGKILIYYDATCATLLGTIRCDAIVNLVPSRITLGDEEEWQLDISVIVPASGRHYRRTFTFRVTTQHLMMKWARYIEREARHLSGRELDLSLQVMSAEEDCEMRGIKGSHRMYDRKIAQNLSAYKSWIEESRGTRHFGQLKLKEPMERGWFYVKKPGAVGTEAYHPRFIVFKDHYLLLYKYEIAPESADTCVGRIDLAEIRNVRSVKGDTMDSYEFSIQLKTSANLIFTLTALTLEQKEAWYILLLWASDFYFNETAMSATISPSTPQLVTSTSSAEHLTNRLSIEVIQNTTLAATTRTSLWSVDTISQIRGWIELFDKRVYAAIINGVFSYYEIEEDLDNEWGDALDAIELSNIRSVTSEGGSHFSVVLNHPESDSEITVAMNTTNAMWAKKWMLAMCSCSGLVLQQDEAGFHSQPPREDYIWKLDRLYQVHRKRFFCLQNHELVVRTEPHGRILSVVPLESIAGIFLCKIAAREGANDYYQMHLHCTFILPEDDQPVMDPTLTATTIYETEEDNDTEQVQTLSLSFFTEDEMRKWAIDIYNCCTNAMINHTGVNLLCPTSIETFPQDLLKTTTFEESHDVTPVNVSQGGWIYYRSGSHERFRRRFFVLLGNELSIYKHELIPDEAAIRYGVIDVRGLFDVQFVSKNCPENAMELQFANQTLMLIPSTDAAACTWQSALLDVKRSSISSVMHDRLEKSVIISRSSTFAVQKENEELLRSQIEALVTFAANLQEWDGSKWVANYYVMTTARVLVFSLAVHLYDEDPDLLSTFVTKHIVEVRSLTTEEENETGGSSSKCSFLVQLAGRAKKIILKCETFDHCLQWMRMLCHSNGKLELKRNASTGVWGSVNRIASLSRHNSFLATGPPRFTEATSGRLSRQEAMRRRTSELIQSRQSMTTK